MNSILDHIQKICAGFPLFLEVYIFWSILYKETPNDLDVLLIYKDLSEEILKEKERLWILLAMITDLPIDFTLLSQVELQETAFLEKIKHYIKIK